MQYRGERTCIYSNVHSSSTCHHRHIFSNSLERNPLLGKVHSPVIQLLCFPTFDLWHFALRVDHIIIWKENNKLHLLFLFFLLYGGSIGGILLLVVGLYSVLWGKKRESENGKQQEEIQETNEETSRLECIIQQWLRSEDYLGWIGFPWGGPTILRSFSCTFSSFIMHVSFLREQCL